MAVKYFSKPVFIATLICLVFFYLNKDIVIKRHGLESLLECNDIVYLQGKIVSSPVKTSSGQYYYCSFKPNYVKNENNIESSAKGIIYVYIPCVFAEAYFPGKLYSITENNGGYFFENGMYCSFYGKNSENGFFVDECDLCFWDNSFLGRIAYIRALCRLQFKRLMYSWGEGGGLLLALISGAKEYINIDIAEAFKNAGLSHILALSGMHLSIFSAIAVLLGKKIKRKKLSIFIRLLFLIIFVWFAGFSPSLLRAFICTVFFIISSLAGTEQPDMIMVLCFSFLLQSILCPNDIYNVGLILSYGAMTGILLFSRIFYIFFIKFMPPILSASLSSSAGAQVFTMPVTLKIFGTFCPASIIATMFVSPLITFFIYSGIAFMIITTICPVLQTASGFFINLQYNVISKLVIFFSQAPIWSLN